jgi:hypothetical protein
MTGIPKKGVRVTPRSESLRAGALPRTLARSGAPGHAVARLGTEEGRLIWVRRTT